MRHKSCRDEILSNKKKIYELYWQDKMGQHEIAKLFGFGNSVFKKYAKELGISGVKSASRMTGKKNPNWKGGIYYCRKNGTTITIAPKTYKFEHVMIAEKALGRYLRKGEVVHHINGNKYDNKNDNLLICTNSYHSALHAKMGRLFMQEHFGREI